MFAAELLMPEPTVRAAWAELADITACAACFALSPTAMQWRLHATSRAQCRVVLVCAPRPLDADCKTVAEMQLVNAVCRFAELAEYTDV